MFSPLSMTIDDDAFAGFQIETTANLLAYSKKLINDPFFENRDQYFVNSSWNAVLVLNDFFIESDNFLIIRKLMELNGEDHFLMTYADPYIFTPFYRIPIGLNINKFREIIDEGAQRYSCWYFLGISGTWACISEYDGDSLFAGFDSKYTSQIMPILRDNPDFVKFI